MIRPSIVVLDTGSGNFRSAANALEAAGATVDVTKHRSAATLADGLVIPGVGAFGAVMTALRAVNGVDLILDRLAEHRPVLGICVGMQVLFGRGSERSAETDGIGAWPEPVTRLPAPVLPHMGWNTVDAPPNSHLFEGIGNERFYFVHSYAVQKWEGKGVDHSTEAVVSWSTYGNRFIAAIEDGPLCSTQFHPEKSGEAGIRLLANWLRLVSNAR